MTVAGAPLYEWLAAACLVFGGLFTLIAGIGLLRLGDVFMRLHASTKAGTMGAGLIGVALALAAQDAGVASRAVICVVFLLLTGPVGAHLIGRAAARVERAAPRQAAQDAAAPRKAAQDATP